MTVRLSLALTALAIGLGACADMPGPAPSARLSAPPTPDEAVGKLVDDVVAINGPPSQSWDMPDGRRVYQWEQASVTARVGASRKGELVGAASQSTCYYTLYAHQDAKGRWAVVGAAPARPGCLRVAAAAPAPPAK